MHVDIEVPNELYDNFREMAPMFVVQEICDHDIPEEMQMYKEKTDRKTVEGTKSYLVLQRQKRSFCTLL